MGSKKSSPSTRPPVVAVLGHVDHGKTTLLDHIRSTRVQAKEAGGITQGIGAYQAEFKGSPLTFIDTPGHAAFSAMRSRGASVADLAILVVAADDGVKPQTKESVKHLLDSNTPFVVAVNKMDRPGVSAETAKAELTQAGVFVEGYGGNTPVVEISAKEGKGIDSLLENLLLLAELEELTKNSTATLSAPVIEARKDMKRGITVSVIVKAGTLRVGDEITTPSAAGKVRALFSPTGQSIHQALPGEPVLILGLKSLPQVGETVAHVSGSVATTDTTDSPDTTDSAATPQDLPTTQLNIILKSDSLGSLEAITASFTPEINLIKSGTGDVTDQDVLLASGTGAIILGFAVRTKHSTLKLAETEGVDVKTYSIIYELLEYLEKKVLRLMDSTIDEEELGLAEVLKVFDINSDRIAGCLVNSGRLAVGDAIHLEKKDGTVKNATIKSLRIGKEEVKEVKAGKECGALVFPKLDIDKKDAIIAYKKTKTDD
jgi:translation initiation factor IF-2